MNTNDQLTAYITIVSRPLHLLWEQEVGGSSPPFPTKNDQLIDAERVTQLRIAPSVT